jgi:hypothetical protein
MGGVSEATAPWDYPLAATARLVVEPRASNLSSRGPNVVHPPTHDEKTELAAVVAGNDSTGDTVCTLPCGNVRHKLLGQEPISWR